MSDEAYNRRFWMDQSLLESQRANRQMNLANHLLQQQGQQSDFQLRQEIEELKRHNEVLMNDNGCYGFLLSQPLHEIAEHNHLFRENYDAVMQDFASWAILAKAYKELAIQFGLEKGLSVEQVQNMSNSKCVDAMNNKNETSHKTNASDHPGLARYFEQLRSKKCLFPARPK